MGSNFKLNPSNGSAIGPDCANRYGVDFLGVSKHHLRLLETSDALEMAGFESIEVIAHVLIWHAYHPLHQVLRMDVEPFASFQRFDQQIEQLSFGGCVGHGLEFSLHRVPSASGNT